MILPNGNSKKYIKTIIGIYILYTIISPAITFATGKEIKLDCSEYEEYVGSINEYRNFGENVNIMTDNWVENTYKEEIKKQLKNDISHLGFSVSNIEFNIDLETGEISNLEMTVSKKEELSDVNSIIIEKIEIISSITNNNDLSRQEIMQIKEMIKVNYGIDIEQILVNSI